MVIADAGFWIALLHRDDAWHPRARDCYAALEARLITTWPVLTEACHFLQARVGEAAKQGLLEALGDGAFDVFQLEPRQAPQMVALMRRYATLPMDLADASLVLLAEHLGHGRILSTDLRDFGAYRWKNREPFSNLLWQEGGV